MGTRKTEAYLNGLPGVQCEAAMIAGRSSRIRIESMCLHGIVAQVFGR